MLWLRPRVFNPSAISSRVVYREIGQNVMQFEMPTHDTRYVSQYFRDLLKITNTKFSIFSWECKCFLQTTITNEQIADYLLGGNVLGTLMERFLNVL